MTATDVECPMVMSVARRTYRTDRARVNKAACADHPRSRFDGDRQRVDEAYPRCLHGGDRKGVGRARQLPLTKDGIMTQSAELKKQRRKLQLANNARARMTLGSVALMACQFAVIEVA